MTRPHRHNDSNDSGPAWGWTLLNLIGLAVLVALALAPRIGGLA